MPTRWPTAGRPDGRDVARARRQEEERLLQTIKTAARLLHWEVYHTRDARGSDPGWPDLVLCQPPRLLIRELKADGAYPDRRQRAWLAALRACGLDVGVWRPSMWDAIMLTLAAAPSAATPPGVAAYGALYPVPGVASEQGASNAVE